MRAQAKSRTWIVIVAVILIIIGVIWYYTGGDFSMLTEKLGSVKGMLPGAGE